MSTTVLHRTSSGEVLKISPKGQLFADADVAYWSVLTDPVFTDGTANRDTTGPDLGPLRVLGFQKHWDGSTVRNATQPEIDGYQALQDTDESLEDKLEAQRFFDTHPRFRKAFKAMAVLMMDELNILRALHALPDRTKTQVLNALTNALDEND